ncbi:MAG: shikimate kinase [Gemmatimonadetes bacterium]|nr:shikimate kinase [Gemmatimonadota bacterium]NIQ60149.1 shikimate kinase [Gemmatimonadota bacterium]NIU80361.1 shikimate kinase [Gammaproteobacteria bacterium]NIX48712.1 shikimate kinase [Gemmatimonadota bacterium]NIY13162.1 shikimate kinase [Gemmatimonadota bacterium]
MSHGGAPPPERIVLVGFMAAGKSTVGPVLARRLGWEFVDLDDRIREETGRTPAAILRDEGEAAFRRLEAALTDGLAGRRRLVLAPGGGWVTQPGLARRLGPGTVRVWLRVSLDEALRRADTSEADRPLLGPPDGRRERVAALLERRRADYAAAELTVDVDGREPADVADEIVGRLGLGRERDER